MKQVITGLLALIGCFISAQEKNLIANGKKCTEGNPAAA